MKILIVSTEVAPFSKTGGLADYTGSLPLALKEIAECDVRVISPFHKMAKNGSFKIRKSKDINPVRDIKDSFELLETEYRNIKFYFIGKDEYYDRDGLYGTPQGGYADNAERFSFFCRAALATMIEIKFYPDIIHINDWQTALLPLYKNNYFQKEHPLRKSKVLFTIHNLGYQGIFSKEAIGDIRLPEKVLTPLLGDESISLIKSGILYSDIVNTVSKKYAEEILKPEYGCGLDSILRARKKDLYGILNGADYSNWNPETDRFIPENYDIHTLDKKLTCKIELLKQMKMDLPATTPLLGSVGRLAEHKGIDVIIDSIDEIVKLGAGFILLGTGNERYENVLKRIASENPGRVGIYIAFDNRLAHMIEAGVDIFVMPSRYEPCGLNQMYSLKYGTIPVVRATGGLDDTIIDYSEDPRKGNGFKFERAATGDFIKAIRRAIKVFNNKEEWARLQKRAIASDFSWKRAAHEYKTLYGNMMKD